MKKSLVVLLLAASCGVAFVAASESEANCQVLRKQIKENHENIDKAYHTNDACTMGKLMIQNRQVIESNMACFPKLEEMMAKRQKLQQAN